MKVSLNTTIGTVRVEAKGHYIEIYTPEETYREGLINLWDYEKDEMTIQPGLQDLILIATEELSNYFEGFKVFGISQSVATLEQMMRNSGLRRGF